MTRITVAFHEAGHAVMLEAVGIHVERATIEPGKGYLGRVEGCEEDFAVVSTEARIVGVFSGDLAAALAEDPEGLPSLDLSIRNLKWHASHPTRVDADVASDLAQAWMLAEKVASTTGERRAYLRWLWRRARREVARRWDEVESVAAALLEHGTLTGGEVRRAIRSGQDAARRAKYSK